MLYAIPASRPTETRGAENACRWAPRSTVYLSTARTDYTINTMIIALAFRLVGIRHRYLDHLYALLLLLRLFVGAVRNLDSTVRTLAYDVRKPSHIFVYQSLDALLAPEQGTCPRGLRTTHVCHSVATRRCRGGRAAD